MPARTRRGNPAMRRLDTTTAEYQRAWRGRHMIGHGTWSYPRGDGRRGTRYLRCSCGWRIVGIYDKPDGSDWRKANELHREHRAEVVKES